MGLAAGLLIVFASRMALYRFEWARSLHRELRHLLFPLTDVEIVVLAGASSVGEEMFFRGALLPAIGLVGSSAIFALLHIGPKARHLPWTASSFAVGLLFGAMFLWTGDLTGPVARALPGELPQPAPRRAGRAAMTARPGRWRRAVRRVAVCVRAGLRPRAATATGSPTACPAIRPVSPTSSLLCPMLSGCDTTAGHERPDSRTPTSATGVAACFASGEKRWEATNATTDDSIRRREARRRQRVLHGDQPRARRCATRSRSAARTVAELNADTRRARPRRSPATGRRRPSYGKRRLLRGCPGRAR